MKILCTPLRSGPELLSQRFNTQPTSTMLAIPPTEEISQGLLLISIVALLAGAYLIFASVLQYWRLRHIPGPPLAAWTNLWLIRHMNGTEKFYDVRKRLHQKYGSVQRYGPNRVMFSDVSAVHSVLPATNVLPKVCGLHFLLSIRRADRKRPIVTLHSRHLSMARKLHLFLLSPMMTRPHD